jgi:hypothetical protein
MTILIVLKYLAALTTAATGLLALVKPTAVYGFTGLQTEGPRGISEIRAIFGGLFIALGLLPLFFGSDSFQYLGFSYLAIALVRLPSIVIDRASERSNWISLVIEIVFGIILVLR